MANYATLKAAVQSVVKTNGNQEITGANMQTVLLNIINNLTVGYQFMGVATPSTTPPSSPDYNIAYIAGAGSYSNFGTAVVIPPTNIAIFKYNGSWACEQVTVENGGVFDITAYNNNTTYADLAAALGTGGANIPEGIRKGGMSIKFVQSSDNKYVQFRYMLEYANTTAGNAAFVNSINWQGVVDEPTANSGNLVTSGGLYKWFALYSNLTTIPYGYYGYDKVIKSISKSDYNITLSFNKFLLTGNVVYDIASTSYIVVDKENINYTIPTANGLFLNIKTKEISVVNINGYNNLLSNFTDNKVLLFVNIYGELVSPISTLQSEIYAIMKGTKYLKLNGGEVGDAINDKLSIGDTVTENVNISNISSVVGEDISAAGATLEKIDGTDFEVKYAEKLTVTSGNHNLNYNFGNIKECEKIKFMFRYKSNKDIYAKMFFWGNGGWINNDEVNDYAVLLPATNEATGFVEVWRPWQSGIEEIRPIFVQMNSITVPVGTELVVADTYVILNDVIDDNNVVYNEVIVAPSGGDFTSVRAAVESINDNTSTNRYKIIVKKGTYEEIDIMTKDYVDIIGESREGVLLWVNGDSTDPAPSDYHYEDGGPWDGVPINEIPRAGKHLFIHNSNSAIENMTLKCTDTKYVIHQDGTTNQYEAIVRNCTFIREEVYNALNAFNLQLVGIGAHGGQYQRYYNCSFFMNVTGFAQNTPFMDLLAVGWHNWRNESMSCGATFKDCNIYGAHFINIHELNSGKDDVVEIDNVVVDNAWRGAFYTLETSGITPETAAYNIKVNITNSKLHFVILGEYREGGVKYVLNPENIALVGISSNVSFGQPVSIKSLLGDSAIATSAPFGFADQDANANEMCYINTGSVGRGLCVADTYSYGDAIYINNGKFTKTANGQQVGICLEAKNLSGDGLVLVGKV